MKNPSVIHIADGYYNIISGVNILDSTINDTLNYCVAINNKGNSNLQLQQCSFIIAIVNSEGRFTQEILNYEEALNAIRNKEIENLVIKNNTIQGNNFEIRAIYSTSFPRWTVLCEYIANNGNRSYLIGDNTRNFFNASREELILNGNNKYSLTNFEIYFNKFNEPNIRKCKGLRLFSIKSK